VRTISDLWKTLCPMPSTHKYKIAMAPEARWSNLPKVPAHGIRLRKLFPPQNYKSMACV
jgi:hypothetical protein